MNDARKFADAMMLAITDDFYRPRAGVENNIARYLQQNLPHVFPADPLEAPIVLTVFENPVEWLTQHGRYMSSDSTSAIRRCSAFTMESLVAYEDVEEGTSKAVSPQDHVDALRMLCELIATKQIFLAAAKSPHAEAMETNAP